MDISIIERTNEKAETNPSSEGCQTSHAKIDEIPSISNAVA